MKQGLIVCFCGPSQSGKDYIMKSIYDALKSDMDCKCVTAYKFREHRVDDPDYIKCVDEDTFKLSESDSLSFMYGDQRVAYSKSEIEQAILQGKIAFIATCLPELAEEIKALFGNNCLNIFIRRHTPSEKSMSEIETTRYGGQLSKWKNNITESAQETAQKRMKLFEKMKPIYQRFMSSYSGADFIIKNFYTFFNGEWDSSIDKKIKSDIDNARLEIAKVYKAINGSGEHCLDWRKDKSLLCTEKERKADCCNLSEDWMNYLNEKELMN